MSPSASCGHRPQEHWLRQRFLRRLVCRRADARKLSTALAGSANAALTALRGPSPGMLAAIAARPRRACPMAMPPWPGLARQEANARPVFFVDSLPAAPQECRPGAGRRLLRRARHSPLVGLTRPRGSLLRRRLCDGRFRPHHHRTGRVPVAGHGVSGPKCHSAAHVNSPFTPLALGAPPPARPAAQQVAPRSVRHQAPVPRAAVSQVQNPVLQCALCARRAALLFLPCARSHA